MAAPLRTRLLALGLAAGVAACSGGGTAETTIATTTTAIVATTTLAEPAVELSDGTATCARIDQAAAEEILGPLLEPPRVDPMAPTCALLANDGIVYIRDISEPGLSVGETAQMFTADLDPISAVASSIDPIDGLGDEAVLISIPDNPPLVMFRSGAEVFNLASEGLDADRLVAVAHLIEL